MKNFIKLALILVLGAFATTSAKAEITCAATGLVCSPTAMLSGGNHLSKKEQETVVAAEDDAAVFINNNGDASRMTPALRKAFVVAKKYQDSYAEEMAFGEYTGKTEGDHIFIPSAFTKKRGPTDIELAEIVIDLANNVKKDEKK